jgi:hypothetical protein
MYIVVVVVYGNDFILIIILIYYKYFWNAYKVVLLHKATFDAVNLKLLISGV